VGPLFSFAWPSFSSLRMRLCSSFPSVGFFAGASSLPRPPGTLGAVVAHLEAFYFQTIRRNLIPPFFFFLCSSLGAGICGSVSGLSPWLRPPDPFPLPFDAHGKVGFPPFFSFSLFSLRDKRTAFPPPSLGGFFFFFFPSFTVAEVFPATVFFPLSHFP